MRGGRDLRVEDFEKRDGDGDFKFDRIGGKPYIFFGETEHDNKKYYRYVIFNNEHFGSNKTVSIFKILRGDVNEVYKFEKISEYSNVHKIFSDMFEKYEDNLKIGLIKLKEYLNEKTEYDTIKKYLNLLCLNKKVNNYQDNSKKGNNNNDGNNNGNSNNNN